MVRVLVLLSCFAACKSKPEAPPPAEKTEAPKKEKAKTPPPKETFEPLVEDKGRHLGNVQWVQRYGGTGSDAIRGMAVTASNEVFIAGYSKDEAHFTETATPLKGADAFIGKLAQGGGVSWVRHFGGAGEDVGEGVALTPDGGAVVVGSFAEELAFGDASIKSTGADDAFFAKFDGAGKRTWVRRLGGPDVDAAHGVAVTKDGRIIVTGTYRGKASMNEESLASQGLSDGFVASLKSDGSTEWVHSFGGKGTDLGRAVAVDPNGNIYLAAEFSMAATFGDETVQAKANRDIALAKYRPNGDLVWVKTIGNLFDLIVFGLATDQAGNVFIAGGFEDVLEVGEHSMQSNGREDGFVIRFTPTGEVSFTQSFGGKGDDFAMAVATDGFGNCFVAGRFERSVSIGGQEWKSAGDRDIFALKLSPTGKQLYAQRFGGKERDSARGLAVTPGGDAIVGGAFLREAWFGDKKLSGRQKADALVPRTDAFALRLSR